MFISGAHSDVQRRICEETTSGGVCINDAIVHLANPNLPFGGVGPSGMGKYHGFYGFQEFSNAKAVLNRCGIFPSGASSSWKEG